MELCIYNYYYIYTQRVESLLDFQMNCHLYSFAECLHPGTNVNKHSLPECDKSFEYQEVIRRDFFL